MSRADRVWLVCTAGLIAVILSGMVFVEDTLRTTSDLSEGVRAQLDERIATILESDPAFDWQFAAEPSAEPTGRSVCAASVFGV